MESSSDDSFQRYGTPNWNAAFSVWSQRQRANLMTSETLHTENQQIDFVENVIISTQLSCPGISYQHLASLDPNHLSWNEPIIVTPSIADEDMDIPASESSQSSSQTGSTSKTRSTRAATTIESMREPVISSRATPQDKLPLPASDLSGNIIDSQPALRGDENWAEPRDQFHFHIVKEKKRRQGLEEQGYKCPGCAVVYRDDKVQTFTFCYYYGKYFCSSCTLLHAKRVLPSQVVNFWQFSSYPVCDRAARFLDSVEDEPLVDVRHVASAKVLGQSSLRVVQELRHQLKKLSAYILSCKFAKDIAAKISSPHHLCTSPSIFSMIELFEVKKGYMKSKCEGLIKECQSHISHCPSCAHQGSYCSICKSEQVLFYFSPKVITCPAPGCRSVMHQSCFKKRKACPLCVKRKELAARHHQTPSKS